MPDPVPAVPDLTRQTTYSPVASAGPFDVGFDIYGNSTDYEAWLKVYLDGVELEAVTEWVLTSPSGALAGLARPITDAQIAPVSGTWTGDLVIQGRQRPRRATQLEEGRGVSARDFNLIASNFTVQAREFFDRMEAAEAAIVSGLPEPDASKAVLVDRVQTFTEAEKARGRDNLGLTSLTFASVAAVQAAQVASDVDVVMTDSYYVGNNAGGARYFRAASEPTHGGKIQSADLAWWELDTSAGVFPMQWGAYADGDAVSPHNDTAAINLALDYIRDQEVTAISQRKYFLDGQSRIYYVTGSLDATLIRARHNWGIRNLGLYAACTGKVVLDLTGSRYGNFQNISIWGDQTNQPSCGIQLARATISLTTPAAGFHTCHRIDVDGYFTRAAFQNFASEQNVFTHCLFFNQRAADGSGEAWAGIVDGSAQKTVQSDFTTVGTGAQAFNANEFTGCIFSKSAAGDALFITGAVGHEFRRCYWVAVAGYANVVINLNDTSRDLVLDGHFETTQDEIVRFEGTGDKTLVGLTVRDHSPHCSAQVFGYSGLNSITLYGLDLRIRNWNTGSPVVFEDNTKFAIQNCFIDIPNQLALGTVSLFISFVGLIQAQDLIPGRTFTLVCEGSDSFTQIWRDDSASPMNHDLSRFSSSPAISDRLTDVRFKGSTSTGPQATYAQIRTSIESPTNGAAYGKYVVEVIKNNVSTEMLSLSGTNGTTLSQAVSLTDATASTTPSTGALKVTGGVGVGGAVRSAGAMLSSSPSGGIGYATGAGNSVTQLTSRTTGVTIDTPVGRITTNNASLAAGASAKFVVTNSSVFSADIIAVCIRSGVVNDKTAIRVQAVSTGSFDLVVHNLDSVAAETGAIVIQYAVIKGVVT